MYLLYLATIFYIYSFTFAGVLHFSVWIHVTIWYHLSPLTQRTPLSFSYRVGTLGNKFSKFFMCLGMPSFFLHCWRIVLLEKEGLVCFLTSTSCNIFLQSSLLLMWWVASLLLLSRFFSLSFNTLTMMGLPVNLSMFILLWVHWASWSSD